jgi:MinD superfamily P-loop ATPase
MIIAVASGKGGTGKTTIATSLALSLVTPSDQFTPMAPGPLFLDCDVEAPNAHIFLNPNFDQRREVDISIPQVDKTKCNYCGKCAEVCQFHAIAVLGKNTLVFHQLCHGCGSCTLICPQEAIRETPRNMGLLEMGEAKAGITLARGLLNLGEPMAVPVIRQLKRWAKPQPHQVVIRDAPPGTSCPVVETLRGADYLLLVTEPTPFGLHDLKLAVQVGEQLKMPIGVVINRYGLGDESIELFCEARDIPVLMVIPFDRAIAEGVARGKTLVEIRPEYVPGFQRMFSCMLSCLDATPCSEIERIHV